MKTIVMLFSASALFLAFGLNGQTVSGGGGFFSDEDTVFLNDFDESLGLLENVWFDFSEVFADLTITVDIDKPSGPDAFPDDRGLASSLGLTVMIDLYNTVSGESANLFAEIYGFSIDVTGLSGDDGDSGAPFTSDGGDDEERVMLNLSGLGNYFDLFDPGAFSSELQTVEQVREFFGGTGGDMIETFIQLDFSTLAIQSGDGSERIEFFDPLVENGGGDLFVEYEYSAIPEPRTWILLLSALGVIGLVAARRRKA